MTRDTHAATTGAWSLNTTDAQASVTADVRRSIHLMGSQTHEAHPISQPGNYVLVSATDVGDPIEAARSWLDDEVRTSGLPDELLQHARGSVDLAFTHFRELDLMAGQLAHDAKETGVLDEARLIRIDQMTDALRAYSDNLRSLLDEALEAPDAATARIRTGMQAASDGGGLTAFISQI